MMDEMSAIPYSSEEGRELAQVMSLFDAPAFIRRARGVEEALASLLTRCRRKREELLQIPRQRLAALAALAGQWEALAGVVSCEGVTVLRRVFADLAPVPAALAVTSVPERLRRAVEEVVSSFQRFNEAWVKYLRVVDLSGINQLRDGYNRYYVLEKACALRSDLLARQGFTPLAMLTVEDLQGLLPPLPVPR